MPSSPVGLWRTTKRKGLFMIISRAAMRPVMIRAGREGPESVWGIKMDHSSSQLP